MFVCYELNGVLMLILKIEKQQESNIGKIKFYENPHITNFNLILIDY